MKYLIKRINFWVILTIDIFLLGFAYFLSYLIRFEGNIPPNEILNFMNTVCFIIPLKLVIFILFRLYKGMWRYTSLFDALNVLKASVTSCGIIILSILFLTRFEGFSRSVFIIDCILTFIFISGIRIAIRLFLMEKERGLLSLDHNPLSQRKGMRPKKKLLIIGAGNTGEKMLREIMDNPYLNYEVVGFLDDDPKKKSMTIHGVSVLGAVSKIQRMAHREEIDEILIAIPSASAQQMRRIIQVCEATGLKTRTTPGIGELINGKVSFNTTREVSFEDLLGRDPVSIDMERIENYITDKIVLVSGAGGSIGSELCRQITKFNPKNLILLDKTENSLFYTEMEFLQKFPKINITSILGDVKYKNSLHKLFEIYKPQVVFHTAAYKHVPLMELNPWEAIFNNIIGTKNIVEASHQFGVGRFIFVSTDKAVRPSSVMGVTKRVSEMVTSCYASNGNRFMAVRFGNVIGSDGSVVHIFKKQIEYFGPVTVTHPEITRYFMTIPEASKLILQAGAMGEGGEIFILDMGTPIKIVDLAKDLISKSGFRPDVDIEIKFTGLRPGEKLHEDLFTDGERIIRSPHEKIFIRKGNTCDVHWLNGKINELVELALNQDTFGIRLKLQEIVPEYQPFDMNNSTSIDNDNKLKP